MRIVVTGCAGFIGSHLCDRLLSEGHEVVGIDSFEDYYPRALKQANLASALSLTNFSLHEANILELAALDGPGSGSATSLATILAGAACVYHLAAQAGVRASWGSTFQDYTQNNILATQRLLEACSAAGIPKVVYASSSSVYGDQEVLPLTETMRCMPRSPYGVTKLAAEHLCGLYHSNYGLDTVALRFFTVYGPRQRPDMAFHKFTRALLEGREIAVYGDGGQTRDFTYVSDIVEGLSRARTAPAGTVMNLGGGNRVSLHDAIKALGRVAGIEPKLAFSKTEAGDVRDTWADVSLAEELIGYAPAVSLNTGLEREYTWIAESGESPA
jgi:UDP-glucose 4-epimerase